MENTTNTTGTTPAHEKPLLEQMFAEGKMDAAAEQLLELFTFFEDKREELAILCSQLKRVENEYQVAGTISHSEEALAQNRVTRGIYRCFLDVKKEIRKKMTDLPILSEHEITEQSVLLQIVLTEKLANRYCKIKFLKYGNTGFFFQGNDANTRMPVIIKVLKIMDIKQDLPDLDEFYYLQQLKHRNIIRVLDFALERLPAIIVIERINGTKLSDAIKMTGGLPLEIALRIARRLSDALGYLRKRDIRHSNMRPSKIYIDDEEEPMISSLDIIRHHSKDELRSLARFKEECRYYSPEVLHNDAHSELDTMSDNERSDQFSVAVILLEMLTGKPLFQGVRDTVEAIFQARRIFFKHPGAALEKALSQFWREESMLKEGSIENDRAAMLEILTTMLAEDPEARYSSLEIALTKLKELMPKSLPRCPAKASFQLARNQHFNLMPQFYERFFNKMPNREAVEKAFVNKEKQNLMLRLAVHVVLDIETKKEEFKQMIASPAHKNFQDPEDYATFLHTLRDTVLDALPPDFADKANAERIWNEKIKRCDELIHAQLGKGGSGKKA
ncbi:MAG: protein kinase domain-containing protein [Saprospiraceae bacterium]